MTKLLVTLFFLYSSLILSQAFTYTLCYEKSQMELQLFNNLYSENRVITKDKLHTFYNTLSSTFIYGINSKLNIGVRPRLRKVFRSTHPTVGDFLKIKEHYLSDISFSRLAITGSELIIRHPITIKNIQFTFQHQIGFPIGNNLSGNSQKAYIDWDGWSLHSQVFYSYYRNKFQLFAESGIRADNITSGTILGLSSYFSYASIPTTVLPGYSINQRNHIYFLCQYTPRWSFQDQVESNYDPYANLGLGFKHFFLNNYEIEFIGSRFYTYIQGVNSYTISIGLRKIWGRDLYSTSD
ncbi:MAG: hypothetical protein HOP11_14085 [Saprospiraceae bacterium]|nr:hypothetical protein [Saprospiraceae bacterium]